MRLVIAHRGRVNCLQWSKAANILCSCSSDGSVQCHDMNNDWGLESRQLFIGDSEEEIHLLPMTIITKDDSSVELMLGTACSKLVRVLATRGEVDISLHLKKLSV